MLSLVPLTVAQPLQASGVVVTIVLSRLMLHERLGRTELACIGVIGIAVLLLGLSSGRGPGAAAGTHAAGLAIAAAAAPACLASLVIYWWTHRASSGRHRYPVTGVSYGVCAGLMYGVAGLALKALSAAVFTAPTAPPAPSAGSSPPPCPPTCTSCWLAQPWGCACSRRHCNAARPPSSYPSPPSSASDT